MKSSKKEMKATAGQKPAGPSTVVIGNGWAALAAVAFLTRDASKAVTWVTGSGSRMLSPLPTAEASNDSLAQSLWMKLAELAGFESIQSQTGSYLREFRNKAFREPAWTKAPTPEERRQVLQEVLWGPEQRLANLFEVRLGTTLGEIEEAVRAKLMAGDLPGLRVIEEVPVAGFRIEEGRVTGVALGSGEQLETTQVIYADRWALLGRMEGLPKALPFVRHRDPVGVLQATFTHSQPMGGVGLLEGFYGSLHREAGEEAERHVWGYFSGDGRRSFWTICLSSEEVEDNHEIAKKLRRMKNALDKMFAGSSWLPEGKADFMATVENEQVLFQESYLFSEGEEPLEPITLPGVEGLSFVTDGYGPSSAVHSVGVALQLGQPAGTQAQAEGVDLGTGV